MCDKFQDTALREAMTSFYASGLSNGCTIRRLLELSPMMVIRFDQLVKNYEEWRGIQKKNGHIESDFAIGVHVRLGDRHMFGTETGDNRSNLSTIPEEINHIKKCFEKYESMYPSFRFE